MRQAVRQTMTRSQMQPVATELRLGIRREQVQSRLPAARGRAEEQVAPGAQE
jgi:hypothetical protein